jgi:phage shock protein B
MTGFGLIALTPAFIILAVAAMLAVIFHFKHKARLMYREAAREGADLEALRATAVALERRMATLESILDAEAPGWRDRT